MLTKFFKHWIASYQGIPQDIWLLAVVNLVNRCGGMVMIFLTVYLTDPHELAYSIPDAGYVLTFFGLGAIVGTYLGGWLTDKIGYYHVQILSLLLNGVALVGLLWIRDFYLMCGAVFAMSIISESFRPANQVAMTLYSKPENRTRSVAVMRMAYNLGFTIAPIMGGILAHHLGWNCLFWIDGITCVLAAIALRWLLAPRKKNDTPSVALSATSTPNESPYFDRKYMTFVLFTLFGALTFMQLLWTIPVFFRDAYHWNENQIGWAMGINGAIVLLVEMPLIFSIEQRRPALTFVRWGLLLYIVSYLVFLSPLPALVSMILYMLFISFGEIFVMPFSSNFALNHIANRSNKGEYMAAYGLSYSLANVLAPLAGTQIIYHFGFNSLWITVCFTAAIAWIGFRSIDSGA
jgi:MFS family permease